MEINFDKHHRCNLEYLATTSNYKINRLLFVRFVQYTPKLFPVSFSKHVYHRGIPGARLHPVWNCNVRVFGPAADSATVGAADASARSKRKQ